jgi:hypothetical protein
MGIKQCLVVRRQFYFISLSQQKSIVKKDIRFTDMEIEYETK